MISNDMVFIGTFFYFLGRNFPREALTHEINVWVITKRTFFCTMNCLNYALCVVQRFHDDCCRTLGTIDAYIARFDIDT